MLMRHKSDDLDPLPRGELFRRLRKVWPSIAITFLLVGAIGTVAVASRQPKYSTTALLLLERPNEATPGKSDGWENKVDTEVEMLRAFWMVDLVARRLKAVETPKTSETGASTEPAAKFDVFQSVHSLWNWIAGEKPATDARDLSAATAPPGAADGSAPAIPSAELLEFERRFRITRRGLTDVIAVEAVAETPDRAAMLANLYADVYLDQQVTRKRSAVQDLETTLRRQIEQLKKALNETGSQIELRRHLDETITRLHSVQRNEQLIQADLSVAAPALPIAKEAFPSRKVQALLVWLLAAAVAGAVGLYLIRSYVIRTLRNQGQVGR